jgi:hypothetical protein
MLPVFLSQTGDADIANKWHWLLLLADKLPKWWAQNFYRNNCNVTCQDTLPCDIEKVTFLQ